MSQVKFISDLHHGHTNICKFRTHIDGQSVTSVEEHDEILSDRILSSLNKRDTLWLLGDLFFTEESMKYWEAYSKACKTIQVVLGNHCTDRPIRQQNLRIMAQTAKIHSLVKYKGFWLSHCPIHPCELRGAKNIYGHTHHKPIDDERYLSVCCEQVDYRPVTIEELITLQGATQ